ncbi:MAG: hypothetical protein AAFP69_19635, partial [Planctomycetota bacterium]
MSLVIESFNYQVGIDARQMSAGAALTRRELNAVKSAFRGLTTPLERTRHKMDLIERAYQQGAVSEEHYRVATERLREKMDQLADSQHATADATREMQNYADQTRQSFDTAGGRVQEMHQRTQQIFAAHRQGFLSTREASAAFLGQFNATPMVGGLTNIASAALMVPPPVMAIAAGVAAATAAFAAGAKAVHIYVEAMQAANERAMDLERTQRIIGGSVRDIIGFQTLLKDRLDMDADEAIDAMREVQAKIGEAALGEGPADLFKRLGLDAGTLQRKSIGDALRDVMDRFAEMENRYDRLAAAAELFGDDMAVVVASMDDGGAALDAMADAAERRGMMVSDHEVATIRLANDNMNALNVSLQAVATQSLANISTGFIAMQPEIRRATQDLQYFMSELVLTETNVLGFATYMKYFENLNRTAFESGENFGETMSNAYDAFASLPTAAEIAAELA